MTAADAVEHCRTNFANPTYLPNMKTPEYLAEVLTSVHLFTGLSVVEQLWKLKKCSFKLIWHIAFSFERMLINFATASSMFINVGRHKLALFKTV